MARKPRLDRAGCLHHVMARGNAGAKIFHDDEDRRAFLRLLAEGVVRYGHTVHAYCLMDNHFHLAVRTSSVPLSRILQNLLFRYTRYSNRRYRRIGHLFQGRFKSVLVEEQSYLLELVRYIHLNPVRAGLVKEPGAWAWSGHRAYLGKGAAPFLDTSLALGALGGGPAEARRRYARFVRQGMGEGHREEFHRGGDSPGVLGNEGFDRPMRMRRGAAVKPPPSLEAIVKAVCAALRRSGKELAAPGKSRPLSEGRCLVGLLAQDLKAATLTAVAERFGRDLTTVSAGVSRLRYRMKKDAELASVIGQIRTLLGT